MGKDLHNPSSPIRRIVEVVETKIDPKELREIKENIAQLNSSILVNIPFQLCQLVYYSS